MSSDRGSILPFSKNSSLTSTPPSPPKILGAETSLKLSPSSIEPSGEEAIRRRLAKRLLQLDVEQIQIVELVTIAIARGQL